MSTVQKPNKQRLFGVVALSIIVSFALVGCWAEAIPVPHPTSTYGFAQCPGDVNSFYIIGGRDEWDSPLDHLLRYDVSEEIWFRLAPLPQPAIAPAATCYGDKIFVVTYDQHLYQYDILSNIWTEASPPPWAAWGAAVGAWDSRLYLVSGSSIEWDSPVQDVDIYEISTDTWLPAAGQDIPVGTILPGYVQTGPYLFVVGGFGENSPSQNVSATQRYDMSSGTWELGPTFGSSRAAFALAAVGQSLFAIGGDMDGGDYLDETSRVESLYLNSWPAGTWMEDGNSLPQALMFNSSGFCSMALTYGEVWSVGGAYPDWETMNVVSINQYYDNTESADYFELLNQMEDYEYPSDLNFTSRGIEALGNCLIGSFGLNVGPEIQSGIGLPGTPVTYTLSLANTGDIPDAYDLSISSDWTTTVAGLDPVWSGTSVDLIVTVDIPQDAMPDDMDVAEITLVSQGDPVLSHTVQITTSRFVGVIMEPPSSFGVGVPGNTLEYPITLYNGTGQTNSFDLTLSPYSWETDLSSDQLGPIPDAGSEAFTVSVTIPPDEGWNMTDTVYITATSLLNQNMISYNDVVTVTSRSYAPPQISISPEVLEASQYVDEVVTQTLAISNGNGLTLTFQAYAGIVSDAVLHMHFNEPSGATAFSDSSENGNNGTCSGDTCPVAGVEGMLGTSLFFDGNDYVLVPDNPSLNPQDAIAISAWIQPQDWNTNRRILQKGNSDNQYIFGCSGGTDGTLQLRLSGVGVLDTGLPTPRIWHHVFGQYDGDTMQIWIDGQLSAEIPATGTIATTADPLHIGTKYAGAPASDFFHGKLDELYMFDRGLSQSEIISLYQMGVSVDWLSVDPITGTVPANKALPVEVIIDAMDLQPDVYTTTLLIVNNDPLNSLAQVPITMTVEPTHGMGWEEGMATDLRSGDPLEATLIAYGQPYTLTSDTETGYYKFWLEQGTYTVEVSAPGYVTQTANMEITAQQGVTQDFALLLDAPWMHFSPELLETTLRVNQVVTQTLILTNTGAAALEFELLRGTGLPLRIVSNDNWRVSNMLEPGWETVNFDDAAWEFSIAPAPVNCGTLNCWSDPEVFPMWSEIQHQTIYLRRSFQVGSGVISATIKTECDDDHDLYINGVLVASDWNGYAGPLIITDVTEYVHPGKNVIAIKANDTAGGCRVMCVDATILTEGIDWLSVVPISGTIPANKSLPIQVTFDTTDLQPDVYTTTLLVLSNDPLNSSVQIPVTMTVEPTASMGWVEGTITDLRTGAPLEATIIAFGQPYTVTSDGETGFYQFWLEQGTYTVEVSAPGYVTQTAEADIIAQQGISQDFALLLDAPWMQVAPENLETAQLINEVVTQTLTITNSGPVSLTFQTYMSMLSDPVLLMHLDEPYGATTFSDGSGFGNNGNCSGDSCPEAGFEGFLGTSLFFDGNDYILIPDNPSLNPQEAIAISTWIYPEDWDTNRRILQKGNSDDQYILGCSGGANGTLQLRLAGVGILDTELPTPGIWHHVLGQYDGSVMQIWIDGQLSAEISATGTIATTSDPLHIGTKYAGAPASDYFHGRIDELQIFNRSLSPSEIISLYHGGVTVDWLSIDPISGDYPRQHISACSSNLRRHRSAARRIHHNPTGPQQ